MPKKQITAHIDWRCNTDYADPKDVAVIEEIVHSYIEDFEAVRANVRGLNHKTTVANVKRNPFTKRKHPRPDPKGEHITFEVQNPKTKRWTTFHFYVTWDEVNGVERMVKNDGVSPNPDAFPPGRERATSLNSKPNRTDKQTTYTYEVEL